MGDDTNQWCDLGFAEPSAVFKSPRQTARLVTEAWVALHGFCPNCAADHLPQLPNNSPVADFRCEACGEEYELKAKRGALGRKITDGAYSAMTARLAAANNPSLFAMSYDHATQRVTDLILVPSHFFTLAIIEPKKPTWPKGRSAPWQGCNILIGEVPASGRISLIRQGVSVSKAEVRSAWSATRFLRDTKVEVRGWLLAVMNAVEAVGKPEFTLDEVYAHEAALAALYPGNNNVRPKIRQQLQVLRDRGWLEFNGRGKYRRSYRA
ncbi:DpnI domain-containing protein [Brevundimonas sp. NPDC092305]|uniref:DpnI domain-containing protein n=1 Tax=Brevundimonas sp. NPDC092305 TaxID=3363957 RepID=UPI00380FAE3D